MGGRSQAAHPLHVWLALALPASARSIRAHDAGIAETLSAAGAELVEADPDVEIGAAHEIRGDARFAVVSVDASQPEGGRRLVRVVRRVLGAAVARWRAARCTSELRRRGYGAVRTIRWEMDEPVRLPGATRSAWRAPARLFPQRALVLGRRDRSLDDSPIIEAVARDARFEQSGQRGNALVLATAGVAVVIGPTQVLRATIGPGRQRIRRPQEALELLSHAGLGPAAVERIPWILRSGTSGLADWSLEQRLPGVQLSIDRLDDSLDDCCAFLTELHVAECGPEGGEPLAQDAEAVVAAGSLTGAPALQLLRLGRDLDERLAHLPRCFAHGDFWSSNLLVDASGRLTGVVDWEDAGPGRLPLLDLLHLYLSVVRSSTREYLGDGVVRHHLPWARAGGDATIDRYCRGIGLEVGPATLEALVLAYWLDRVAREMRAYSDRAHRPVWMRRNVGTVLESLPA